MVSAALLFLCLLPTAMSAITITNMDDALETLSDNDLERICLDRGFELVPQTGRADLTHQDYVDAALQCLKIEQEMNEILDEHPELAHQLEEEIQKMKEEKERLEKDNELRRQQIRDMQRQLEEREAARLAARTNDVDEENTAAGTNDGRSVAHDSYAAGHVSSEMTIGDGPAAAFEQTAGPDRPSDEEPACDDRQAVVDETSSCYDAASGPSSTVLVPKSVETVEDTDTTLKTFYMDFLQTISTHIRRELRTVLNLLLPITRPILHAGDIVWRHVKTTIQVIEHHVRQFRRSAQRSMIEDADSSDDGNSEPQSCTVDDMS